MKRFPLFILVSLLLCPILLTSCAHKQPLYRVVDGTRTYEIYGNARTRRICVSENGVTVWEEKIKAEKNVGEQNGTYGFAVMDMNFDGLTDLKIALSADGEKLTEVCYLQDANTGQYKKSESLSQLYTVGVVPDQQLVLSYLGITTDDSNGSTVETVVSYRWQNDSLIPYRRLTVTYYPSQSIYCYGVSDYLEESRSFDDPSEQWLSPEKFAQTDWSFFYYFR